MPQIYDELLGWYSLAALSCESNWIWWYSSKRTLFGFRSPWINPKLCRNFIPGTIPGAAIVIVITFCVQQNGRAQIMPFSKSFRVYNLAIISSFDAVGRTNPKRAVIHEYVRFFNFSLNLTTFVPIGLTKQLHNNFKTIIVPPIQLDRTYLIDTDFIASFKSRKINSLIWETSQTRNQLLNSSEITFKSHPRTANHRSNTWQELPSRSKIWHWNGMHSTQWSKRLKESWPSAAMCQRVSESSWVSICFNPDFDSKKLMKVIHKKKNIMNKEFQHFVESQLIQVTKMKMQMTQWSSAQRTTPYCIYCIYCEKNTMKNSHVLSAII
jgi:hypothetical protein